MNSVFGDFRASRRKKMAILKSQFFIKFMTLRYIVSSKKNFQRNYLKGGDFDPWMHSHTTYAHRSNFLESCSCYFLMI